MYSRAASVHAQLDNRPHDRRPGRNSLFLSPLLAVVAGGGTRGAGAGGREGEREGERESFIGNFP